MKRTNAIRRKSGRSGSTVVELTLVLLIVIWMLVGTVDVAQVVYFQHSLTYRAKKAVRWAAAMPYNETQIRNKVIYDNPAGGARPVLMGLDARTEGGASIVGVQLLDAGTSAARVQVTVEDFPFRFFTPGIARAYTARAIVASHTHEPSLP